MKNKIYFFIIMAISLFIAIINGTKFPYFVFIFLLSTYVYSYYSIKKASERITGFFWVSEKNAIVGDLLKLRYKVLYNGFNPIPYCEIRYKISRRLGGMKFPVDVAFIKPFGTVYLYKEFDIKHRGFYRLGEVNVIIRDLFNMFEKEINISTKLDITVYPRYHYLNNLSITPTEFFGNIAVKNAMFDDYTSISMIRDYVEGDNLKLVDWKLSARHDDMKVRKNDLSASTKVYIFLDGYKNNFKIDEDQLDELLVETAASIINYSLRRKISTTLMANNNDRINVSGMDISKLDIFLKELIRFNISGEISFNDFIDIETRKLTYLSTIILITTKLDQVLFSKLVNLKQKRFFPILMMVKDDKDKFKNESELEMISYLNNIGVGTYTVDSFENIKEVLEGGN